MMTTAKEFADWIEIQFIDLYITLLNRSALIKHAAPIIHKAVATYTNIPEKLRHGTAAVAGLTLGFWVGQF